MRWGSRVAVLAMAASFLVVVAAGTSQADAGLTLSKGSTPHPAAPGESGFLATVVVESAPADSGDYTLSGKAQQDGYQGSISLQYSSGPRQFTGRYDCSIFEGPTGQPTSATHVSGTLSGVAGTGSTVNLAFSGTVTVDTFNYERDVEGMPLYELNIEKSETTDLSREITFSVEWPEAKSPPATEPPSGSRFTIVISPDLYLRGAGNIISGFKEGTRLEVVDGLVETTVQFDDLEDVLIKGRFDPESGKLIATLSVSAQEIGSGMWKALDATLEIDLAREGTAGFMTISGRSWLWAEDDGEYRDGDDKGPTLDYYHRVHYSVEGLTPEYAEKVHAGDVDSNLRFVGDPPKGVLILRAASGEFGNLEDDPIIYVGDTIIVPPGGHASFYQGTGEPDEGGFWENSIAVSGGTYLTIKDKAELLSFGEFYYNHRWQESHNPRFDDFEMEMAHLKVKLKGTAVVVRDTSEGSTVMVVEGSAICTDRRNGQSVELTAGHMLMATGQGLGPVTAFDPAAERARWEAAAASTAGRPFPKLAYIPLGVAGAAFVTALALVAAYLTQRKRRAGKTAAAVRAAAPALPRRYCPGCGRPDPGMSAFCQECGHQLRG